MNLVFLLGFFIPFNSALSCQRVGSLFLFLGGDFPVDNYGKYRSEEYNYTENQELLKISDNNRVYNLGTHLEFKCQSKVSTKGNNRVGRLGCLVEKTFYIPEHNLD